MAPRPLPDPATLVVYGDETLRFITSPTGETYLCAEDLADWATHLMKVPHVPGKDYLEYLLRLIASFTGDLKWSIGKSLVKSRRAGEEAK